MTDSDAIISLVTQREAELRLAQLQGDVSALEQLLDDALLFTGTDGARLSKADDLAMHRARVVRFTSHEPQSLEVRVVSDDVAVTALHARLAGRLHDAAFTGDFRYTRVWARREAGWRVVAGQVSATMTPPPAA